MKKFFLSIWLILSSVVASDVIWTKKSLTSFLMATKKDYQLHFKKLQDHDLAIEMVLKDLKKDLKNFPKENHQDILNVATQSLNATLNVDEFPVKESPQPVIKRDLNQIQKLNKKTANRFKVTKEYILNRLVDDQTSSEGFVSSAHMRVESLLIKSNKKKISFTIGGEILGVTASFGPSFEFLKDETTYLNISGDGIRPLVVNSKKPRFDLISPDGKKRRLAYFSCDFQVQVSSQELVNGSFKVAGFGADNDYIKKISYAAMASSQRVLVPDSIDGQMVTPQMLYNICHKDFKDQLTNNGKRVFENVNEEIESKLMNYTYVNNQMECLASFHCNDWYNNKIAALLKWRTVPRCVQNMEDARLMTCQLRGHIGARCPVYINKKLVSRGYMEYPCDKGLSCQIVKEGGFFKGPSLWSRYVGECKVDE